MKVKDIKKYLDANFEDDEYILTNIFTIDMVLNMAVPHHKLTVPDAYSILKNLELTFPLEGELGVNPESVRAEINHHVANRGYNLNGVTHLGETVGYLLGSPMLTLGAVEKTVWPCTVKRSTMFNLNTSLSRFMLYRLC